MESKTLTIMFTDIKDFTKKSHALSREENLIWLSRHEEIIKPLMIQYGGRIIKALGDAFLVAFESPTNSLLAARAVQNNLKVYNEKVKSVDQRIELKIGISSGEVSLSENDIFGEAVNIASRIVSIAQAGQILFSDAVYHTMNKSEIKHSYWGSEQLKGIPEPVKIYKVLMEGEDPKEEKLVTSISSIPLIDDEDFKEKRLDHSELPKVFDFTNVEVERQFESEITKDEEKQIETKPVEILELDSAYIPSSESTDPSRSKYSTQYEHSKEVLTAIRNEKTKKKRSNLMVIAIIAAFVITAFLSYKYIVNMHRKKAEELLEKKMKDSVISDMTPTPTHTAESKKPTPRYIEYSTLIVRSDPPGAVIYLNNKSLKLKTPAKIGKITSSKATKISLLKEGYRAYYLFFDLIPGEEKEIDAVLQKK